MLLMLPAFLNGAPLFYFDTAAYLHGADAAMGIVFPSPAGDGAAAAGNALPTVEGQDDGTVKAGRSIYYGLLVWMGWKSAIWLVALVQCTTLAWLLSGVVMRLFGQAQAALTLGLCLALCLALTLASSAGLFASLVMPDIWAGLAVLALAMLWLPNGTAGALEKTALFAIIAFSTLSHNSHIALMAALIGMAALASFALRAFPIRPRQLALPALALAMGLGGSVAFSTAVQIFYGDPPLARPHITAHLIDLGPGTRYAQASCPDSGYALCDYADRLPVGWIPFLFSRDPELGIFETADVATQRALADEQLRFAIGTLAHAPGATMAGLTWDGLRQIWTLELEDLSLTQADDAFVEEQFAPDLARTIRASRLYQKPDWHLWGTPTLETTSALAALGLVLIMAWSRRMRGAEPARSDVWIVVWILLAGLLANALICGILASPYGRFQARIVWLLPLASLLALAALTIGQSRSVPSPSHS